MDIAASIIGYVRQAALGVPLVPYGDRVKAAMQRVQASRKWTDPQRLWLRRYHQAQLTGRVDGCHEDEGVLENQRRAHEKKHICLAVDESGIVGVCCIELMRSSICWLMEDWTMFSGTCCGKEGWFQ